MKICVITLQNVTNYGSVLQTYATQSLFQEMGYEVEFIDYTRANQTDKSIKRSKINKKSFLKLLKSLFQTYIESAIISVRKKKVFHDFLKEKINTTSKKYYSVDELRAEPPEADIYCTGSDQMWNSGWNGGIEHSYYLDFVDDKPKFAFSTSIGMNSIPENEKSETIELLKKYRFITVREKSAEDLLNTLGIKSTTVLDPTLLLNGDFWRKFASSVKMKSKKYILVYQLNSSHDSIDFIKYVKELSSKMGIPVKVISYGIKIKRVLDEYVCLPTIEEFVALFMNAEYVVTDSFHGLSFCINLNKNFTVIYPPKYSSRLINILELCNLKERVYTGIEDGLYLKQIDYKKVNSIMEHMREKSLNDVKHGVDEIVKSIK